MTVAGVVSSWNSSSTDRSFLLTSESPFKTQIHTYRIFAMSLEQSIDDDEEEEEQNSRKGV